MGSCFISCSDTSGHLSLTFESRKHIVVDKMVIEFEKQIHIGGIDEVWLQSCVGVRYESLLKGIKSDDTACWVVKGIRCLAKVWTPACQAERCQAALHVRENVFFDLSDLGCRPSCCVERNAWPNFDETQRNELGPRLGVIKRFFSQKMGWKELKNGRWRGSRNFLCVC